MFKNSALILSIFSFATVAAAADPAPVKVTDREMRSDQLFRVTADGSRIVYIDHTGRLYSIQADGTGKKLLSGGEVSDDRILVLANQGTEFALVEKAGKASVYFQGRENPLSFRIFFYRVDLDGTTDPEPLFQMAKPFTHVLPSPDGSRIYLVGSKHAVLDLSSGRRADVPVSPVYPTQFKLSPDGNRVVYVAQSAPAAGRPTQFELRSYDLAAKTERTVLAELDRSGFPYEISADSNSIAALRCVSGACQLVLAALDHNEMSGVYPVSPDSRPMTFDFVRFLPAIRGSDDPGRLLFSYSDMSGQPKLYAANLSDLRVDKVPTGEVDGEMLGGFRLSPDSKTLAFSRSGQPGRTYTLDLVQPDSEPAFVFQSTNGGWEFLPDGASLIYSSSGAYYAANELLQVSIDGKKTTRLSAGFPQGWIGGNEATSRIAFAGDFLLFAIDKRANTPGQFRLMSVSLKQEKGSKR